MKEGTPRPSGEPEAPPLPRPSLAHVTQGLTQVFTDAGGKLTEGFPPFAPKGTMRSYEHATKTLILHPWIAPRARADALLQETIHLLSGKPRRKRGNQAEAPREALIHRELATRYGLSGEESAPTAVALSVYERAIIDHIADAIDTHAAAAAAAMTSTDPDAG